LEAAVVSKRSPVTVADKRYAVLRRRSTLGITIGSGSVIVRSGTT
jgi:hypothetical protein